MVKALIAVCGVLAAWCVGVYVCVVNAFPLPEDYWDVM